MRVFLDESTKDNDTKEGQHDGWDSSNELNEWLDNMLLGRCGEPVDINRATNGEGDGDQDGDECTGNGSR